MEKFYFKSYDRTIGSASNLEELKSEMKRLSSTDPASLEYHLRQGHITMLLNYIGETAAAKSLDGVTNASTALGKLGVQEEKGTGRNGMHRKMGGPHGGRGRPKRMESGMQK